MIKNIINKTIIISAAGLFALNIISDVLDNTEISMASGHNYNTSISEQYPYPNMNAEDLNYTRLGKPDEIVKNDNDENIKYTAKWYFNDEKYGYTCSAKVVNINEGRDIVKGFTVYGDSKHKSYNDKIYSNEDMYEVLDDGTFKYLETYSRNDFEK